MCKYCEFLNSINFDMNLLTGFEKIYVLVSGGVDSTLLAEAIKTHYPKNTYFVNCFNPYESNLTLDLFKKESNYIEIKPDQDYDYGKILKDAFLKLNDAADLRKNKKYHKKIFKCCYFIKHKAFLNNPLFQNTDSVVISGIKRGDGHQRGIWLTQLSQGREPSNQSEGKPTFLHRHLKGQLYCYPFRDYMRKEFPNEIMNLLYQTYPNLKHSGCAVCPVLVLFNIKKEERFNNSVKFTKNLIQPNENLMKYCPSLKEINKNVD